MAKVKPEFSVSLMSANFHFHMAAPLCANLGMGSVWQSVVQRKSQQDIMWGTGGVKMARGGGLKRNV